MATTIDVTYSPSKEVPIESRIATIETGLGPYYLNFHENGSNSYLFSADYGSNIVSFYKFDPSTVSGTITTDSRTATFATGTNPFSVKFHENGSNSYLFTSDSGSNIISFYKFDPATVSGTITTASRTATFATGAAPYYVDFHENGSNSYLFSCDFSANIVSFYKFDPSTVSGTITTASRTATFALGTGSKFLTFHYNGVNSYLFASSSTANIVSFYKFDPATISGTVTTAFRTATFATGTRPQEVLFHENGSNSYLFTADSGSNIVGFYKFDPATISGTVTISSRTATFATGSQPNYLYFKENGSNSYLFSSEFNSNSITFYKIDPSTISGTITTSSKTATLETDIGPSSLAFYNNGINSLLFSADNGVSGTLYKTVGIYKPIVDYMRSNTQYFSMPIPEISKTLSTPLTLNTEVDSQTFVACLDSGSQIDYSFHPTEIFDYDFVVSGNGGTLNENFVFSGASAGVSGEYRITMGPSTTVTLANKPVYNDSFTILSTGTLKLISNTELGEEFILSAGTTVEANDGVGPYTLTIPYEDPGLILGTGITVNRIGGKTQVRALWL